MTSFKVRFDGVDRQEALEQVEQIRDIGVKERNCLLLLTEEMFSMMAKVLENREASFEIARKGNEFSLGILTKTQVSETARNEYLDMSTDGRNMAYEGIKGKMIALYEAMALGADGIGIMPGGTLVDQGDYSHVWKLSMYMDEVSEKEKKLDWDRMEKSIIATFADDILIGVRNKQVEMTVKKTF